VGGKDPQSGLQEDDYFRSSAPRARETDFNTRLYIRASEHRGQYLQSEFKTGRVQEELEPSQRCDGAAGSTDGYNLDGQRQGLTRGREELE